MEADKIKALKREIELLKEIIRLKDCQKTTYIPYYPQPVYPMSPVYPCQPWPNYPNNPYIGDLPNYRPYDITITC